MIRVIPTKIAITAHHLIGQQVISHLLK